MTTIPYMLSNSSTTTIASSATFLNSLTSIRVFAKEYIVPICVLITFFNNSCILIIIYSSKSIKHAILNSVRMFYIAFAWSDIAATIFYHGYRYVRMRDFLKFKQVYTRVKVFF